MHIRSVLQKRRTYWNGFVYNPRRSKATLRASDTAFIQETSVEVEVQEKQSIAFNLL